MKHYLPNIVREHGYKTVREFLAEYSATKTEHTDYKKAVVDWEKRYGIKVEPDSIKAKLEQYEQQEMKCENRKQRSYYYSADRGAR